MNMKYDNQMNTADSPNKQIFLNALKATLCSPYDEAEIDKYFTPDFMQYTNEVANDIELFKSRLKKVNETFVKMNFEVINLMVEGNIGFANYIFDTIDKDGVESRIKVIMQCLFKDNKISEVDVLTFNLSGTRSYTELGREHLHSSV